MQRALFRAPRVEHFALVVTKFWMVTAAVGAAVAVLVLLSLPPRRLSLETPISDGTLQGEIHVHTNRSDGSSSPEEVAAAAARTGHKFLIFTDHGDATRPTDAPAYRSGVLCIDAVEISTTEGHYIALDMPTAPYPLAGDARGVVEDVRRLGGFGIAAHPDSPKPELSWRDWDAPFDGIEWLNPDTSWRLEVREVGWRSRWNVVATLLGYPFRPSETIAQLFGGTGLGAAHWRRFAYKRRVVLLAGADAHANLELANTDPGVRRLSLPLPSYEASFGAISVHVKPDRPLTGDAAHDATTILQALRRGHLYVAVDGLATPPSFQFTATNSRGTASEGDTLEQGGPVTLRVRSNAPSSFLTMLWHDEEPFATVRDEVDITRTLQAPAIFRAAIVGPPELGSIPWIISNPIYVGVVFPPSGSRAAPISASTDLFDGRTNTGWRTETDPTSIAALDVSPRLDGAELRMRYGLSSGTSSGQYASLAVELKNIAAGFDRLTFTARAEHPMRISVQFQPLGRAESWQRSIYLDDIDREQTVWLDEATPIGATRTLHPDSKNIHDILFVVETTHSKPGASGRLWIRRASLQR